MKKRTDSEFATWRRDTLEWQRGDIVAGRRRGPEPPGAWASRLRQLIDVSRQPEEGPTWWTPGNAYYGNLETRTEPEKYFWDGMNVCAVLRASGCSTSSELGCSPIRGSVSASTCSRGNAA